MNVKTKNAKELEALLEFYAANGVDCALDEKPRDRFSQTASMPGSHSRNTAAPLAETWPMAAAYPSPFPPSEPGPALAGRGTRNPAPLPVPARLARQAVPDAQAFETAREMAKHADSLEALRLTLDAFESCNLKRTAKNLVFGDGNPNARVMFVGEAPGRDEDISGIPFVGRSGELLNKMCAAIGLVREKDVYIANIVPWRPPGNRTPTAQEIELCRPFVERQIALVNPDILVPLGAPAARELLNTADGIMKLRGRTRPYALPDRTIEALPTLHPAYLLRQPGQKRFAWMDFLQIRCLLLARPVSQMQ